MEDAAGDRPNKPDRLQVDSRYYVSRSETVTYSYTKGIVLNLTWFSLRVLDRIGARALVAHVRTFADFLVYEFSTSAGGQQLNKCIEILNDMVWKYNIVTLDRLILCLVRIMKHTEKQHTPIRHIQSPKYDEHYFCSSACRLCAAMKGTRLRCVTS